MTGLARSTYYYKPKVDPKIRVQQDLDLRDRIEAIQAEFPAYGYRRVEAELRRQGEVVNTKRVRRVMKLFDLRPVLWGRGRHLIQTKTKSQPYPNVLKHEPVTGLNQAWVVDLTYIRIRSRFVFLAAILDLYSRKVIGWALSKKIDRKLCVEALGMAIRERNPRPGCIHHSDQGVQYTSEEYLKMLRDQGFRISMSARARPGDNAFIESFFKTLKYEEVHLQDYQTWQDVLERVPYFIEEVYNQKRLHSSIGYRPPVEYEQIVNLKQTEQVT